MPIHIGGKTYEHFRDAEAAVARSKPGIKSPGGYVASIERKERGTTKPKRHEKHVGFDEHFRKIQRRKAK